MKKNICLILVFWTFSPELWADELQLIQIKPGQMATEALQCYDEKSWKVIDQQKTQANKNASDLLKCEQKVAALKKPVIVQVTEVPDSEKFYEKTWLHVILGVVIFGSGLAIGQVIQ